MEALINIFKGLGPGKSSVLAIVTVAVLGFFGYLMTQASTPDMTLLFANLDPADGAKIVEKLRVSGVPVEIKGDGAQIYAPSEKVAELRMQLAQDGLPNGGSIGYEIFDKSDVLGTSSVMLDINQMRALEGELSRSIRTVQGVQSARVHLVLPKRELFAKEKSEPAASVVLKMKGAARLSANQIQAVQYLVSSAVPNLTTDKISIIDDKGTLLARGREQLGTGADGYGHNQGIKDEYEEKMARQIELLLEKTLGLDKVRTEISAEMDFDRITTQSVDYNPDGQVAKSTSTSSEGLSEQENSSTDAVSIQNALPDAGNSGAGNQSKNNSTRSEENTNFEISNTTKTMVKETGTVKRLSVAVLVDGLYETGADGKVTYKPRPEEEIKQLTELVKTAVGFKEDRGDVVKVINMRFSTTGETIAEDNSMFKKLLNEINVRKTVELLIVGIFGLVLLFGWLKPMVQRILSSIPKIVNETIEHEDNQPQQGYSQQQHQSGGQNYQVVQPVGVAPIMNSPQAQHIQQSIAPKIVAPQAIESMINIENIEGRVKASSIKKMSEVIERHPEEAVSIIRNWMYS